MAHAYTPGLQVTQRTLFRARRVLPIPGQVLVQPGQRVNARDIVARTELPGDATPVNLANLLSLPAGDVPTAMLRKDGDWIGVGEVIARTRGVFGMFKTEYASKVAGTIESISSVTGQVIIRGRPIPVEVRGYLTGQVVEVLPREGCVVEAAAAFVQGIFGIGGEAYGRIRMACTSHTQEFESDLIHADMKGQVLIGGARVTGECVRKAIEVGAAAIVSGGIDDQDLRDVLGYDLGVAITGTERIGLTLIITEGFGEIAMAERTFHLLASHAGADASVNGATQIRAGVMRPEIVIPLVEQADPVEAGAKLLAAPLTVGSSVRIIRDPYFGVIGTVAALPSEPRVLDSGSRARILEVDTESGERLSIPRANVEIIGG